MFDPFASDNEARDAIKVMHRETLTSLTAIIGLLVDKGVFTQKEYDRARLQAIPLVEQMIEEKIAKDYQQWREDNPERAKAMDFMNRMMGGAEKGEDGLDSS